MARYTLPPRQKMINLLYILLIAMLAINITSDAQKREKQQREKELKQLTEDYNELDRQIQQKKKEEQEVLPKENTDFAKALIINDSSVGLTEDGQLETPVVMIASSASNQLYSSYKNPLNITTIGVKASELHLEMKNGIVQRTGNGWTVIPEASANEVKLIASYEKAGNRLPIGEFRFRVKTLPSPTSYLRCAASKVYRGNVPMKRSMLLSATEVGASIAEPEMEYKVISFETILIKENGKQISTLQAEGNKLTLEQKMLIAQLEEGDAFYITSIRVEGADGQKRQSNPINVIVIK